MFSPTTSENAPAKPMSSGMGPTRDHWIASLALPEVVLGANVTLTASTPIIDVTGSEPKEYRGRVPARSVVVPGTRAKQFPAGEFQLACALIIGQRKESTDRRTSLNEALRDFGVSV